MKGIIGKQALGCKASEHNMKGNNDTRNASRFHAQWFHLTTQVNNTGVALLEKGLFGKALKVFKTLALAKDNEVASTATLTKILLEGQGILAACEDNINPLRLVEVSSISDANPQDDIVHAAVYGPSRCVAFPLRVDSTENEQRQQESRQFYVTAVALYNHAVATQCRMVEQAQQDSISPNTSLCCGGIEKSLYAAKSLLAQNPNISPENEWTRKEGLLALVDSALGLPSAHQHNDEVFAKNKIVLLHPKKSLWNSTTTFALRLCKKKQALASAA